MPEREIHNLETHHEKSDVNVRALLWAVAIFVVFGFITHGVLYVMFHYFAEIARGQTNEPMTEVARPGDMSVPQTPRLQPFPSRNTTGAVIAPNANTPVTDMEDMRRDEEEAQKNAAWIDQSKGRVRLPIEVAKQLVVQRGLALNTPAPAAAPAPAPAPATSTTTGGAQP